MTMHTDPSFPTPHKQTGDSLIDNHAVFDATARFTPISGNQSGLEARRARLLHRAVLQGLRKQGYNSYLLASPRSAPRRSHGVIN